MPHRMPQNNSALLTSVLYRAAAGVDLHSGIGSTDDKPFACQTAAHMSLVMNESLVFLGNLSMSV